MSIEFAPQQWEETKPRITVIGVGGAGGNAVNNMINGGLEGVEFVVANTDSQSLQQSLSEQRIQLGVHAPHEPVEMHAQPDLRREALIKEIHQVCFAAAHTPPEIESSNWAPSTKTPPPRQPTRAFLAGLQHLKQRFEKLHDFALCRIFSESGFGQQQGIFFNRRHENDFSDSL